MKFHELQQIVESNAKSIQALGDRLTEVTSNIESLLEAQKQAESERAELRRATIDIVNRFKSLNSDWPTIIAQLDILQSKVDKLLERQRLPE